jgi:D-3-phosphoglycerate dehydrogenase
MKLLIADKLPNSQVEKLRNIVGEVEYEPDLTSDSLADHITGVNILIVRGTRVSAECIERSGSLELIVRAGAGTENIDIDAASGRGVYVANCPDKNSAAVAELTMGLLLAVDRRIPEQDAELKRQQWNKTAFSKADGLKGKIFGVIGTGAIGTEVIKRAKAFDMPVVAWSRNLTDERAKQLGISRAANVEELIGECDIISLHVAFTEETKRLISAERIAKLKPGAIILNTSRGGLIDNVALSEALASGRLRAGFDVYQEEPPQGNGTFANVLTGVPNWVGTHHVGASTTQAQMATADETVRIIENYVRTGDVGNCVNFAKETPALYELVVRHYDKIGVLTRILNDLRESKTNVHEVHNMIFEGSKAAVARIQLDTPPPKPTLDKMAARSDEIIQVRLIKLQPKL